MNNGENGIATQRRSRSVGDVDDGRMAVGGGNANKTSTPCVTANGELFFK